MGLKPQMDDVVEQSGSLNWLSSGSHSKFCKNNRRSTLSKFAESSSYTHSGTFVEFNSTDFALFLCFRPLLIALRGLGSWSGMMYSPEI